jgi:hypothetical protein
MNGEVRVTSRIAGRLGATVLSVLLLTAVVPTNEGRAVSPSAQALEIQDGALVGLADSSGALGVYWDQVKAEFVVVYPPGVTPTDPAKLQTTGVPARTQLSDVTAADVEAAKNALQELDAKGALAGESWGVALDLPTGLIHISGSGDPTVVQGIMSGLGKKAFFTREGRAVRLGRLNDTAPFWGGAKINSGSSGCTSGFSVRKTTTLVGYMVTAGHCWVAGSTVKTPAGLTVGSVRFKAAFPARDVEFIGDKTYGNAIYIGDATGTKGTVGDARDPVAGVTYCTSGAYSTELCNKVAIAVNVFHCFSDGSGCTDKMVSFSNGLTMLHGDSGGPMYLKSGSTVYARGTIIGAEPDGTGYAQQWSAIAAAWGVSICLLSTC